jgi:hypothetical protein
MYLPILGRPFMADDSRGWTFRLIDYLGFSCILVGVEEGFRSLTGLGTATPWYIWLSALGAGFVLMWFGDAGPRMKARLAERLAWLRSLRTALAENPGLKIEIQNLRDEITQFRQQRPAPPRLNGPISTIWNRPSPRQF